MQENNILKRKPLRLLPAIIILAVQWAIWFGVPYVMPEILMYRMFIGLLGWLAVAVWWGFFSRALRFERLGAVLLMIVSLVITSLFVHESVSELGQGMMLFNAPPFQSLVFVLSVLATYRFSHKSRRIIVSAVIFLSCAFWLMLRSDGISGHYTPLLTWRWSQTSEEQLLLRTGKTAEMNMVSDISHYEIKWPGFRGGSRDSIIYGKRIDADWSANPPVEIWRRSAGPGCSSFAVFGDLIYTQEQYGEFETVTCYKLNSGKPVWMHKDKARFYDTHAGAGPRSTPTISEGRIYALGATGILNSLDAATGSVIWSRNAAKEANVDILAWGFTGSPLVLDNKVIIALSGKLAAYDWESGKPLWSSSLSGDSFSSPHLLTIKGIRQVVLMSIKGAISIDPDSGHQLWAYSGSMNSILQPALSASGDLLLSADEQTGLRCLNIKYDRGNWDIKELWTSSKMKINFNDFIVHKGYAYGFDSSSIACVDINDGKRMWEGSRYQGFTILLADQDLLIVLSEKGELAIVQAKPDKFVELGKIKAINGKTWNHPVLVDDIILVRNSKEMAAFRVKLAVETNMSIDGK